MRLPKLCDFYDKYSQVFPNFISLPESTYMFKNIQKKQKIIDDQFQRQQANANMAESILEEDRIFSEGFIDSVLHNHCNASMSLASNRRNRKNEQSTQFQQLPQNIKIDVKQTKKPSEDEDPFEFNPPAQFLVDMSQSLQLSMSLYKDSVQKLNQICSVGCKPVARLVKNDLSQHVKKFLSRGQTEESSIQLNTTYNYVANDILGDTFQEEAKKFLNESPPSEPKEVEVQRPSFTDRPSAIASERTHYLSFVESRQSKPQNTDQTERRQTEKNQKKKPSQNKNYEQGQKELGLEKNKKNNAYKTQPDTLQKRPSTQETSSEVQECMQRSLIQRNQTNSPESNFVRNNFLQDFAIQTFAQPNKMAGNSNSNSGRGSSPAIEGINNPLSQQPLILAQTTTPIATGRQPISALAIEQRQSSFGLITTSVTPSCHFYHQNRKNKKQEEPQEKFKLDQFNGFTQTMRFKTNEYDPLSNTMKTHGQSTQKFEPILKETRLSQNTKSYAQGTAANVAQPTTKKPSGHFGSIPLLNQVQRLGTSPSISLRSSQNAPLSNKEERKVEIQNKPTSVGIANATNPIAPIQESQTLTTDYRDDEIADEIIDENDIIAEECESPRNYLIFQETQEEKKRWNAVNDNDELDLLRITDELPENQKFQNSQTHQQLYPSVLVASQQSRTCFGSQSSSILETDFHGKIPLNTIHNGQLYDTNQRSVTSLSQMNNLGTQPVYIRNNHQTQGSFGVPNLMQYPLNSQVQTISDQKERYCTDNVYFQHNIPPHIALLSDQIQMIDDPLTISSLQPSDYRSEFINQRSPQISQQRRPKQNQNLLLREQESLQVVSQGQGATRSQTKIITRANRPNQATILGSQQSNLMMRNKVQTIKTSRQNSRHSQRPEQVQQQQSIEHKAQKFYEAQMKLGSKALTQNTKQKPQALIPNRLNLDKISKAEIQSLKTSISPMRFSQQHLSSVQSPNAESQQLSYKEVFSRFYAQNKKQQDMKNKQKDQGKTQTRQNLVKTKGQVCRANQMHQSEKGTIGHNFQKPSFIITISPAAEPKVSLKEEQRSKTGMSSYQQTNSKMESQLKNIQQSLVVSNSRNALKTAMSQSPSFFNQENKIRTIEGFKADVGKGFSITESSPHNRNFITKRQSMADEKITPQKQFNSTSRQIEPPKLMLSINTPTMIQQIPSIAQSMVQSIVSAKIFNDSQAKQQIHQTSENSLKQQLSTINRQMLISQAQKQTINSVKVLSSLNSQIDNNQKPVTFTPILHSQNKQKSKKPQSPQTKMGPQLSTQAQVNLPINQQHQVSSYMRQKSPDDLTSIKAFETSPNFAKQVQTNQNKQK